MNRSEVKLYNSKKIVIFHTQNDILKQKNITGSGLEGMPQLFFTDLERAFFSVLLLYLNYKTLEITTRTVFRLLT